MTFNCRARNVARCCGAVHFAHTPLAQRALGLSKCTTSTQQEVKVEKQNKTISKPGAGLGQQDVYGSESSLLQPKKQAKPENNSKLVLLFFILVIGTYTFIIQHRFSLPDSSGAGKVHRKHLRLEHAALRHEFESHNLTTGQSTLGNATVSAYQQQSEQAAQEQAELHKLVQQQHAEHQRLSAAEHGAVDPDQRAGAVRNAMRHAWSSYVKFAWGMDELCPMSQTGKNSFSGLGATPIDAMSTLWLMGLKDEFKQARDWVADNLQFNRSGVRVSFFETNIRIIGGLISAYDMSGDKVLLAKVKELADRLLPAFEENSLGIPGNDVSLETGESRGGGSVSIAEFGTLQLEWVALADRVKNQTYADKVESIYLKINELYPNQGLLPTHLDQSTLDMGYAHYSMGAMADSYFEYLLKLGLYKGKKGNGKIYLHMWEMAMDACVKRMMGHSSPSNLAYVGEASGEEGGPEARMEHLACFLPGNMALGVHYGVVSGAKAALYMDWARNITYTCWQMYARTTSGLAGEAVYFNDVSPEQLAANGMSEMRPSPAYNILRPEAVESLFYLWRLTGDTKYQDWGWQIFQAFETKCKVEAGYAGTPDVTQDPPPHDDTMQSFFLAETLKYLYLLFSPAETLSLDEWVLNTEAHPLKIPLKIPRQVRLKAVSHSRRRLSWPQWFQGSRIITGMRRVA